MKIIEIVRLISLLHSTGSSTATAYGLAQEIVSRLDVDWTRRDLKFLDPACGRGTFLLALLEKLVSAGHSPDHVVANMLYGTDIDPVQARVAQKAFSMATGVQANIYCEDSLTKEWNMKFDAIVTNPPYQRANSTAKRWTLWEDFVKKAMTQAHTVAMVVPQSLTSPNATFDVIKRHCSVLNIDVSKHFSVGSTFCYFVAQPNQQINSTQIITSEGTLQKDITELPFLPAVITEDTLAKLDALLNRKSRTWRRGELHTSNSERFDANGRYSVMHTNAQELRSNFEHDNRKKIRVAVSLSGYPQFRVIQNGYVSQACFWTEFDQVDEAQAFADECNGPAVQELLTIFKWSGWNSKEVIECL